MSEESVSCDRSKYCKAKKVCPIPKYIKLTMLKRYPDNFECPRGLFYIGVRK